MFILTFWFIRDLLCFCFVNFLLVNIKEISKRQRNLNEIKKLKLIYPSRRRSPFVVPFFSEVLRRVVCSGSTQDLDRTATP